MKLIICALLLAAPGQLLAQKQAYVLNGKISGNSEGAKVYLMRSGWEGYKKMDSTFIRKGKFVLKGKLSVAQRVRLVIDRTPKKETSNEKNWVISDFYLENSTVSFSANADSMPAYYYRPKRKTVAPVISGSATEEESVRFKAELASQRKELNSLHEEYLKVYHIPAMDGSFNTKEGVELSRKMNALDAALKEKRWNYIAAHPASVISFDNGMEFLQGLQIELTAAQLDELEAMLDKGWKGTPQMKELQRSIAAAKRIAIGEKYLDFSFTQPDGNKVQLSQLMPKGKYVLLEFWASWCGPCRGEIPHLREINKNKADNFEIISISLDERDADWKKAMKEENMTWTQLCDPHGFAGEIAKAYNINGIPYSLLLDKEGKIIKAEVRGAQLDLALEGL